MYKIISKILARRIKGVLSGIISPTQTAFLKGRQILDGVLVANEVVNFAKKKKKSLLLFKVDFEKAYDSVSWEFLDYMMERTGFCEKWRSWIKACIFTGNVSILVNGSPTEEFSMERGLRQGDPLAPFLLLLVAEGLTGLVNNCVRDGLLEGFEVREGLSFPVLQFADDTLFLCKYSRENLWCLKAVLRAFELVSGLRVNFHKSCLMGINVEAGELYMGARFLYCKTGALPFKFLGVPVGANPRVRSTWIPLIEKMKNKLSSWRSRQLSIGGRITLINSVIASLPLYYFSFYKAPKIVIQEMVKIQRNFLWGGNEESKKIAWVKWSSLCLPKGEGGLGIRNLEIFNIALLGKWKWKIVESKESLWLDLLKYLYVEEGVLSRSHSSIWWKDLESIDTCLPYGINWFNDAVKLKLGNGSKVKFWTDCWCSSMSLAELFPRLFDLAACKNCSVAEAGTWEGNRWLWQINWETSPADEDVATTLLLDATLKPIAPVKDVCDKWCWRWSDTHVFTVKSAYSLLISRSDSALHADFEKKTLKNLWLTAAPSKYLVHAWRFLLDRLPTKMMLIQRGVALNQTRCAFCSSYDEDSQHVFFDCSISVQLWTALRIWLGLQEVESISRWDHIQRHSISYEGKKSKRARYLVWVAAVWVIWFNRNRVVFRGIAPNVTNMINHVKGLSWSWFAHRIGDQLSIDLPDWINNPIDCLNLLK